MNVAIEKDIERLSGIAENIADANEAELLELKIGVTKRGRNINLIIDSVGGVSIQTCAKISKGLEYKLMEEEYADGKFKIEVSSPGVDRPLSDEGDFRRKTGRMITLWHTDSDIDSPVEGVIKLVSNGVLSIETSEETVKIKRVGLSTHSELSMYFIFGTRASKKYLYRILLLTLSHY